MQERDNIFILIFINFNFLTNPSYIHTRDNHTQSCSSYQELYNQIGNEISDLDSHILCNCSSFLVMLNKNKFQNLTTTEKPTQNQWKTKTINLE
jgi:hypothetical protein